MTVSNVSTTTNPYSQTIDPSSFKQRRHDFKALANALQSGDLSSAQSAFAALQKDLPNASQASATPPVGQTSQAATDFQTLQSALNSGDLSGAQKAFASLKTDLQSTKGARGHHHHRRAGSATDANTGSSSSSSFPSSGTTTPVVDPITGVASVGLDVQA